MHTLSPFKRAAQSAVAGLALLTLGLAGCSYNEELGRNQLLIGGAGSIAAQADQAWAQIKEQEKVSTDTRYTSRLNRVAPKIVRALGEDPATWDYVVFDSDDLNAFALPGNHIGVYTGIMDIMENDAQLAAVVGHEVAHVRFNHSQERMAQSTLAQIGVLGVGAVIGATACESDQCQQGALTAASVGAMALFLLPHSRSQELEADVGGLRLMAKAGYNPCEAIEFWQNMQRASANQSRPPEFLSTHPGSDNRITTLRTEAQRLGYRCS
ncbi:hypothetical protein PB2503_11744 [Parvularcula bermudensis HTCC2503]|uniref:Peptidase M48 domain-containing protein n=1 Tax=Parvularcula bermudensis (strain ATCC BAA-594 / HTCC2503 / KCTC 12087) TaxID=314260 RepID=E0TDG7_PARBH|nr:M48 family metallopeptidase [Parvularcula bermudensis]ADM10393.1 hypothetical protein PB2503_11744 [Parvularcula bermudensis HTCC2503]